MPRKAPPLKDLAIRKMETPGRFAVGGVDGLSIDIESPTSKRWVLRLVVAGKRRNIGLGGYPRVTLEQARETARRMRSEASAGLDPKQERLNSVANNQSRSSLRRTFAEVASECHSAIRGEFKNKKHAEQWINTLETYAYPILGSMLVDQIERRHVLDVLKPIWNVKTETATRVRGRIQKVLSFAKVAQYRTGENPALWVDNLQHALGAPRKINKRRHHPSLPVADLPRFMAALAERPGVGARALEFTILTAARTSEVRFAKAAEFDLEKRVWTVPSERMKAGLAHRVPLGNRAVTILRETKRLKIGGVVFVGQTKTGVLSENTQNEVIKDLHDYDVANGGPGFLDPIRQRIAVAHGMRSTFKDWARTTTSFPDEASELALAHVNADSTRAAYARDELMDIRARLMDAWESFCFPAKANNVTALRPRKLQK